MLDVPEPGIEPCLLCWLVDSLLLSHQGSSICCPSSLFFFFFFDNYLFIWLHQVLVAAVGSWVCHAGSFVAAMGLSSCGPWAELLCGTWDRSSPTRIEPVSPALQDRFLSTGPPGKSLSFLLMPLKVGTMLRKSRSCGIFRRRKAEMDTQSLLSHFFQKS